MAFLLTDGEEAPCVRGEAARNPTTEAGLPAALNREFESVEEAEAFICHRVAYPREPAPWRLETVSATRTRPLADIVDGLGFASVSFDYALPRSDADLRLDVSPFAFDVAPGEAETVRIAGREARLVRGREAGTYVLQWRSGGLSFYVLARLPQDYPLQDLVRVLETIE